MNYAKYIITIFHIIGAINKSGYDNLYMIFGYICTYVDAEFQLESNALPIIGFNPEDQGSGLVQADAVL